MYKTNYEPIIRTAILAFGCIVGGTVALAHFTGDMADSWATFAGAGIGAFTTVVGAAGFSLWHEDKKRKEELYAITIRIAPRMADVRYRIACAQDIMTNIENGRTIIRTDSTRNDHFDNCIFQIENAHTSWQTIPQMLEHFPDTAEVCLRLEQSFPYLLEREDFTPLFDVEIQETLRDIDILARKLKVEDRIGDIKFMGNA